MRELKFRAWSNEYDHYCSGLQYDSDFGWEGILESEFEYQTDPEPLIELYTGLKDKNGKEIYEGDIVEFKADHHSEDLEGVGSVKMDTLPDSDGWENADYLCWAIDDHCISLSCAITEVIGNIHENPELLEGKK